MLPNSRIIPSSHQPLRARSNSAANDTSLKKGFISRLLTTSPNTTNTLKEYNTNSHTGSRQKYESILGIQSSEEYAAWGAPLSPRKLPAATAASAVMTDQKHSTKSSSGGFGKLFKKRGKANDEDGNNAVFNEDDLPKVRPVHSNNGSRKHNSKIPLAPPPNYPRSRAISQPNQQQFLTNLPDQYVTKRSPSVTTLNKLPPSSLTSSPLPPSPPPQTAAPTPLPSLAETPRSSSAASFRKSSGSCSIYSTFGGNESEYSIEAPNSRPVTPSPLPIANSEEKPWQNPNTSTTTMSDRSEGSSNGVQEEDETTDDDEAFVDATGFSQEDIEREHRQMLESNLTKRLSGGHFGSAGGLLLSINQSSMSEEVPPVPTSVKRKSQKLSTDDELAQSMLNWKRHSDSSKRWSMRNSAVDDSGERPSSTITVIDIRTAATTTTTATTTAATEITPQEEELSVPDKMALRKEAEETLTGANTPPSLEHSQSPTTPLSPSPLPPPSSSLPPSSPPPPPPPPPASTTLLETLSNPDTTQISSDFSKAFGDVWKTSDDSLQLLSDPFTKKLQDSIQTRVADHESKKGEAEKIKEAANSLWKEDETIVVRERMAEWLGQGKPFESAVLQVYMSFFVFTDMRLDSAFRKLCSKLYFKAEAQQIDRILESFANRYWECNLESLFGSADVVYAVVYSLLLLNTDLHVAQGNHARMTRSEFIRNTMSTVRDQRDHEELMGHKARSTASDRNWESELEQYLKEMYVSVKSYQILQPLSRRASLSKRGSIMGSRRVIGLKRSVNSIIRKSGRESMLVSDSYPDSYHQSSGATSPTPPPRSSISSGHTRPITPSPSMKSARRSSFSSSTSSSAASFSSRCGSPTMLSPQQQQQQQQQPMMQYMDTHASSLFSSRPPYYKEGVVVRKHLLENAHQKARHREWRECYLEVHEGELRMYTLHPNSMQTSDKSLFRHSSVAHFNLNMAADMQQQQNRTAASFGGVLPNKWASQSQLMGKLSLNHTLANPLPPPGYNRARPHVFAIQQSDGGVYLFQVSNAEQAYEWVSTCNYWAARESKEPLPGGVSNMEYGWGSCLDDVIMDLDAARKGYDQKINYFSAQDPDSIAIHDWMPPTATMVSSQLSEVQQMELLQKHLVELNQEINRHRDIKTKIMIKFPSKSNNYAKALHNWETRSKYLLHEIIKYQNYCDALENSIQKREEESMALSGHDQASEEEEDGSLSSSAKLEYSSNSVDLFDEINQELRLKL